MSSTDHLRLFIGTGLGYTERQAIQDGVRALDLKGRLRWAPAKQWHVTSLFIGDRAAADVDRVIAAMRSVALHTSPFNLLEGKLAGMPEERPGMLWVRFDPQPAHRGLHEALAHAVGLPPDPREPFWPHITVARGSVPAILDRHLVLPQFRIDRMFLFRSDPGPQGTEHRSLATVELAGEELP